MDNTQVLRLRSIPELSRNELQKVHGGHPLIYGLAIAAFAGIIADWDNFKNGLAGRKEQKN